MKPFFERIKSILPAKKKVEPQSPAPVSAANEPITAPRKEKKADRFSIISWVVTVVLVVSLLGGTVYYKSTLPQVVVTVSAEATEVASTGGEPVVVNPGTSVEGSGLFPIIFRKLQVKTNIPERPRYEAEVYRVVRGDSMYRISETYKVKSETILYVNEQLEDNPHSLRPGMELTIPPVDGLYYEWQEGDTFESVAKKFFAEPEDIIEFSGNQIDLTNPVIEPGTVVMVPGGSRELRNWAADLATQGRGAGTGTSEVGGNVCGGGPVSSGFGWPADDHTLSGNAYGPGHLGIDISAPEGANVYAAGTGVVTMAAGGWNYGYGNVVQIDHGNGYVTVYAHLSTIFVSQCQTVGQGAVIGLAGNTGNSFGAHLHFEIRVGGANINPYDIVQ